MAQHGTAYFAHEQVAGKGQRGKTWAAERGSSLILSVVLDPHPLGVEQQFALSACVAMAACEFFTGYAGDATRIKWPNDLYWHDRKAGGILIENIIGAAKAMMDDGSPMTDPSTVIHQPSSAWQWAIAGIGINLNQVSFPAGLKNPVSLRQITGKTFDPPAMARELCTVLTKYFSLLIEKGVEPVYEAYRAHLYKKNEPVRFKKENRVFEAVVRDISPAGHLIVQHAMEEELRWGEAEWLVPGLPGRGD